MTGKSEQPHHEENPPITHPKDIKPTPQVEMRPGISKIGQGAKMSSDVAAPIKIPQKRKKKRTESFATYIYKLLRSIHTEIGVSRKAMLILNSFVDDILAKIIKVASGMSFKTGKKTISATEIQLAAQLILPGELARHATGEISKSIKTFNESKK
eukprot:GAHX01000043.1.p1 GENE.GAHX01000043.1~~GAHX01000043.1.p1  ORF type:complete len:155 (+),score=40.42 GAHX01000043.1:41-505(+)